MRKNLYRKIFKALNEDLNMILSDDDFEEPEIDLGVHISNIQKKILSDSILKKCESQDVKGLKELINNCWGGQNPIFLVTDDNIRTVIQVSVKALGNNANLNWIDTSQVTNMNSMFYYSKFNGDISKWDVSNVIDMSFMFNRSKFNRDISGWDVSSVQNMKDMFANSAFNGDISKWDVSNVTTMESMFLNSKFNGDISGWNVVNVTNMWGMFAGSDFNGDISGWDVTNVSKVPDRQYMFHNCLIKKEYKPNFND